jgi:TnpA family transposase
VRFVSRNGGNSAIFFGKDGNIASNRRGEQVVGVVPAGAAAHPGT